MKKISVSFVILFAICFAFCNISTMEGLRQEEDEYSNEGVEFAEKHPLPRNDESNETPNLADILKRLQAVEKK